MIKFLSSLLAGLFLSSLALAQSSPGLTYGQVPTAGQWNSYFAAKQDVLGFTPLNQAGGTMTGRLRIAPSTTVQSGLQVLPGVAPTVPSNGDVWLTGVGLYYQAGGSTFGPVGGGTITGPGSSTIGDIAIFSNTLGTALSDSGKTLPAGAIVGTTDTQTLTNKSISASQVNSGTLATAQLPNAGVVTGGVITGTYPALTIGISQVANAMLANMATLTVKSNVTGSPAVPADNTLTSLFDTQLGSTWGSVAYRGTSGWTALAPSSGNFLQSNGVGANPSWAAISSTGIMGHRLTISTGTPVLSGAVASATTIYSTPYESDVLLLWNGTQFLPTHCAETSQLLSDATKSPAAAVAASNYDLFAWNDSGTCRVTRGPVWTNATTRALALSRANGGILTNSTSITNGPAAAFGTYVGTIRTDAGGATVSFLPSATASACGVTNLPIWNMYNRVPIQAFNLSSTASHTYTSSTWRQYQGSANCAITFVQGLAEDNITAFVASKTQIAVSNGGLAISVGLDSTTTPSSTFAIFQTPAFTFTNSISSMVSVNYNAGPVLGYHAINALEQGDNTNANTFADLNYYNLSLSTRY
ncbi:hypothetical protein AB9E14_23800 [Rhizobium leguminosarum]